MGVSGTIEGALEGFADVAADPPFEEPFNLLTLFLIGPEDVRVGSLGNDSPAAEALSSPLAGTCA